MTTIKTCTWAPTVLTAQNLTSQSRLDGSEHTAYIPSSTLSAGPDLQRKLLSPVQQAEELGIDYLLVAQRWWGSGEETEGSSYDCLAMTDFYATHTDSIQLITAIHPGFFLPGPIAKWGATLDRITNGRWSINVTSGWNEAEFGMYGADLIEHDKRYERSTEFIQVLQGAWSNEEFSFAGKYYKVDGLRLEPRPTGKLEVFQGGQSTAALNMACQHTDWMFLNGGSLEKIARIIEQVRTRTKITGRQVQFALYSIPVCRSTDAAAKKEIAEMVSAVDPALLKRRAKRVDGAKGMWENTTNKIAMLDSNEGYASGLIGSPDTILRRMEEFHMVGVDCFHLTIHDEMFNAEVLPFVKQLST